MLMIRPLATIWTLLFFPLLLVAQNPQQIDSLSNLLEDASDEVRKAELSGYLWTAYIDNDIDLALQYAEQIIEAGTVLEADTILSYGYQKKGSLMLIRMSLTAPASTSAKHLRSMKKWTITKQLPASSAT